MIELGCRGVVFKGNGMLYVEVGLRGSILRRLIVSLRFGVSREPDLGVSGLESRLRPLSRIKLTARVLGQVLPCSRRIWSEPEVSSTNPPVVP